MSKVIPCGGCGATSESDRCIGCLHDFGRAGTPSYHDLHITTRRIPRTSIVNLPFRVRVQCSRVGGWEVWALAERDLPEERLGGEYDADAWLVLDVAGHVICDSRREPTHG